MPGAVDAVIALRSNRLRANGQNRGSSPVTPFRESFLANHAGLSDPEEVGRLGAVAEGSSGPSSGSTDHVRSVAICLTRSSETAP